MKVEREWLAHLLQLLMQIFLGAILAMVFLLVILRYVFHTTIIGGNEATLVAFVFASIFAATLALRDDDHIAVRFFSNKMHGKTRGAIAVVRWLLLMGVNLALLVYSIIWIQRTGDFLMPAMGLPQWIAQISIPIGSGLGFVYCASACRAAFSALTNRGNN